MKTVICDGSLRWHTFSNNSFDTKFLGTEFDVLADEIIVLTNIGSSSAEIPQSRLQQVRHRNETVYGFDIHINAQRSILVSLTTKQKISRYQNKNDVTSLPRLPVSLPSKTVSK